MPIQMSHGPSWFYDKFGSFAFACLDHVEKTPNGWKIHPYRIDPYDLLKFTMMAEENGYSVNVTGGSEHHKDCAVIHLDDRTSY